MGTFVRNGLRITLENIEIYENISPGNYMFKINYRNTRTR